MDLSVYAERWTEAGRALQRVRHDELRRLSDEEARQAIANCLDLAASLLGASARTRSGLVEQQRRFAELRP
jgi:hypothetical protein